QRRHPKHHRPSPNAPIPSTKSSPRHPSRPIPPLLPLASFQQTRPTPRPSHHRALATRHSSLATSSIRRSISFRPARLLRNPRPFPAPPPASNRNRRLLHHRFLSPPLPPKPKNPILPRRPILLARPRPPRRPRPSRRRPSNRTACRTQIFHLTHFIPQPTLGSQGRL